MSATLFNPHLPISQGTREACSVVTASVTNGDSGRYTFSDVTSNDSNAVDKDQANQQRSTIRTTRDVEQRVGDNAKASYTRYRPIKCGNNSSEGMRLPRIQRMIDAPMLTDRPGDLSIRRLPVPDIASGQSLGKRQFSDDGARQAETMMMHISNKQRKIDTGESLRAREALVAMPTHQTRVASSNSNLRPRHGQHQQVNVPVPPPPSLTNSFPGRGANVTYYSLGYNQGLVTLHLPVSPDTVLSIDKARDALREEFGDIQVATMLRVKVAPGLWFIYARIVS